MIAAAVLALCVLLVFYPFAVYPGLLALFPERPVRAAGEGEHRMSASLLFCAYNEGVAMPDKLANLRALKERHPDLEILAYNDGSTDETGALLASASDIVTVIDGPGRTGKAHGMKLLSARATGDLLVFTDANVRMEVDAIDRAMRYFADPHVGGVLGSLYYEESRVSASAFVGSWYWRLEERLKDRESRTGNVMGADGSLFCVRRSLYPEFPDNVLDDLYVSMSVVFAGRRLIKANDVIAWERQVAERTEEVSRKVRIACRSWITHCAMRRQLWRMSLFDQFKYASRKLVRWFGALWIVSGAMAMFILLQERSWLTAIAATLASLAMVMVGYTSRGGPLAALVDILLAYFSTLRGIVLAMRGRQYTVWSPAKSRL